MMPFLYSVAATYYEKHGTDISNYTFAFPNRRSGLFFQKYLSEIIPKPIFSPRLLTINELFMAETPYRTADKMELLFRIYGVYRAISKSEETFDTFTYWGEMLLGDFDDVDKYLVDVRQLFTNVKELKEIEQLFDFLTEEQIAAIRTFWTNFTPIGEGRRQQEFLSTWEILYPIYEQFRKELQQESLAYEGMIFRDVAERLAGQDELFTKIDKVIFVGFNALTPCERKLFAYLKKLGKADFYWDYEAPQTRESGNPASLFYAENIAAFPSAYSLIPATQKEEEGVLPIIEKPLHLVGIPSSVGQTKEVYRLLSEWNLTDEEAFRTAVVLPEEKFLLPLLYSLPNSIANINVTMGFPLAFTPLAGLVDYLFDLQHNVRVIRQSEASQKLFYHRDVLSILNHQYIFATDEKQIAVLIKDIKHNNRFYISEEELGKTPLLRTIFQVHEAPNHVTTYLLNFLQELQRYFASQPDTQLEREFLYHYYITIKRTDDLLQKWAIEMTSDTFFRLLRKLISGISIPFTGEPLNGLQVMGVLETRALDFDNLIITSMNEGIFPKKQAAPSFVPYNLRKGFGMPTAEHQDSIFAYHFYRLIHRAKNIYFLYDTRSEGLQTGEVSRFIHQLRYHHKWPIAETLITFDVHSDEKQTITVQKTAEVQQKLAAFYSADDETKRALSATAVNTYLDCPLKFYFAVVEKLSVADEVNESIEANDFGTMFHAIMEDIYEEQGKHSTYFTEEVLASIAKNDVYLEKLIRKAFAEHYLHTEEEKVKLDGRYYIIASILKKYTKQLLRRDSEYAPFEYIKSEFHCHAVFPVFDGKRRINLHGYIDRIDKKDNKVRLIDYKTGSGKVNGKDKDKRIFSGIEALFAKDSDERRKEILQLFMYSMVYQVQENEGEIMPAIIFLRNLFDTAEHFNIIYKPGKEAFVVEDYNRLKIDFEENFRKCLEEIFDEKVPFTQCNNEKPCTYCDFSDICKR